MAAHFRQFTEGRTVSALPAVASPIAPSNSSATITRLVPWDLNLVALLSVNMAMLAAAWIAIDRVWPWSINMGKGSFNQGVVLAVGICGGSIAALVFKSQWRGLVLAIIWSFASGYTLVTVRWTCSSPGFFARHQDEIIADSTLDGLRTLAMFAAACFVTLWWRCWMSQSKRPQSVGRSQFQLKDLVFVTTVVATYLGLFKLAPSFPNANRPLPLFDSITSLFVALPCVLPIVWLLLQPRVSARCVCGAGLWIVAFVTAKGFFLWCNMGNPAFDPWWIPRHCLMITIGYSLVALINGVLLRTAGYRWARC
jgi:hypothetical protein